MYANDNGRVNIVFGKFPMDMETTEAEAFKIIFSMKQQNQAGLLIYAYFYCGNKVTQHVPVEESSTGWVIALSSKK